MSKVLSVISLFVSSLVAQSVIPPIHLKLPKAEFGFCPDLPRRTGEENFEVKRF